MPGSVATSSMEPETGGRLSSSRATSTDSVQRPPFQPHVGPAVDQLEPPPLSAAAALEAHEQVLPTSQLHSSTFAPTPRLTFARKTEIDSDPRRSRTGDPVLARAPCIPRAHSASCTHHIAGVTSDGINSAGRGGSAATLRRTYI